MLEAIRCYKQAMKLVPNIEKLVYTARVVPGWCIHILENVFLILFLSFC